MRSLKGPVKRQNSVRAEKKNKKKENLQDNATADDGGEHADKGGAIKGGANPSLRVSLLPSWTWCGRSCPSTLLVWGTWILCR